MVWIDNILEASFRHSNACAPDSRIDISYFLAVNSQPIRYQSYGSTTFLRLPLDTRTLEHQIHGSTIHIFRSWISSPSVTNRTDRQHFGDLPLTLERLSTRFTDRQLIFSDREFPVHPLPMVRIDYILEASLSHSNASALDSRIDNSYFPIVNSQSNRYQSYGSTTFWRPPLDTRTLAHQIHGSTIHIFRSWISSQSVTNRTDRQHFGGLA
jgi:large exoprotein involved in heme utilization and adhesion